MSKVLFCILLFCIAGSSNSLVPKITFYLLTYCFLSLADKNRVLKEFLSLKNVYFQRKDGLHGKTEKKLS